MQQLNIPPIPFVPVIPKEKNGKAWTEQEKQTVLTLGASGMKADRIMPYLPGRTKASIQGLLSRNLAAFKVMKVAQQHVAINNNQQQTQGDKGMYIIFHACHNISWV